MSSLAHTDDTVWIVNEPDFCFRECDAKARLELLMHRAPEDHVASYEAFAETIEDLDKRRVFVEALDAYRERVKSTGSLYVPWPAPAGEDSPSDAWAPKPNQRMPTADASRCSRT